jgi:biotin-dependent carboxylase-like uncharacterized protein
MDRVSLAVGNVLLGNQPGAAAIEWALSGGVLEFTRPTEVVLTGAEVGASLNGADASGGEVLRLGEGDVLEIGHFRHGRFLYVCVAGGIDVPLVLGGRGTYLPAALGGYHGRRLADRDELLPGPRSRHSHVGVRVPAELDPLRLQGTIGVMRGPQAGALSPDQWNRFFDRDLAVDGRSDRAGVRLTGMDPVKLAAPEGRSEPACVGALQLTPDGTLIVIMPDGPTVGGYPKVAVVTTADLPRLAQVPVGGAVRFRHIDISDARQALERQSEALSTLTMATRKP